MYVPSCPNRAAETAGDFVVAQINVRAARRADCGSGAATNLLFPFTFETLDNRAVLPFPKILKLAEDGRVRRWGCFFANPQLQAWFWRKRREVATALATNRAFRRRILHLLEATVRAFKTDFCRRRTGHRTLTPGFPSLSAPSECRLDWLAGPHNFRAGWGRLRGNRATGDFGFANKSRSLFNDKARCFQISLQCAF
jgi:hypothetical protein